MSPIQTRRQPARVIRIRWDGPRLTIQCRPGGRVVEREVGPRGRLNAMEVAAVLRMSPRTVFRLVSQGLLRGRRVGRSVSVTVAAVVRYLEDQVDRRGARQAIEEMRRSGQRPIPWEDVKRTAGLG